LGEKIQPRMVDDRVGDKDGRRRLYYIKSGPYEKKRKKQTTALGEKIQPRMVDDRVGDKDGRRRLYYIKSGPYEKKKNKMSRVELT